MPDPVKVNISPVGRRLLLLRDVPRLRRRCSRALPALSDADPDPGEDVVPEVLLSRNQVAVADAVTRDRAPLDRRNPPRTPTVAERASGPWPAHRLHRWYYGDTADSAPREKALSS